MTNAERILSLLAQNPGLDDDEISQRTGVSPRQQVNIICRRLAGQGLLARKPGSSGKIGNFPVSAAHAQTGVRQPAPAVTRPAWSAPAAVPSQHPIAWNVADLRETLILIPCSGRKSRGGASTGGCSPLTDDLPPSLSQRLADARRAVLAQAEFDHRKLMPAWQRYEGTLYSAAAQALHGAADAGLHVLIISGGYGVIKACEPIGFYSMRLKLSAWPRGLLEEVLLAYAARHRLNSVRAFVSQSTDYRQLVARTRWADANITDAVIVAPEAARGAMVKVPRAQGQAIAAFLAGKLTDDWRSSDGLRLHFSRVG